MHTRLLAAGVFGFAAFTNGVIVQVLAWSRHAVVHPMWSAIFAAFVAVLLAPWLRRRAQHEGRKHPGHSSILDGVLVTVLAYLLGVGTFTGLMGILGFDVMRMMVVEGFTTGALTFLPTALLLGGSAGWMFRTLVRRVAT